VVWVVGDLCRDSEAMAAFPGPDARERFVASPPPRHAVDAIGLRVFSLTKSITGFAMVNDFVRGAGSRGRGDAEPHCRPRRRRAGSPDISARRANPTTRGVLPPSRTIAERTGADHSSLTPPRSWFRTSQRAQLRKGYLFTSNETIHAT